MSVLQRMPVDVRADGEHVLVTFGNASWRFGFETAFMLSWEMRKVAKACKRAAGDTSHHYRLLGTLRDANAKEQRPLTPGKVFPVNRPVLGMDRVSVQAHGTLVHVKFGADRADIPYKAAQVIGQWIRVRAKEAKARAGDGKRHWSKIIEVA